jgi:hypothetical protein
MEAQVETDVDAIATTATAIQLQMCEIEKVFDFELWKKHGKYLSQARGLMQWDIGDWLIEAEVHGRLEQAKLREEATFITGLEWGTLKNLMWVSRRIPASRRRDDLSYSHHREVAKFDEANQEMLLDRVTKGLPRVHNPRSVASLKTVISRWQKDGTLPQTRKPRAEQPIGTPEPDEKEPKLVRVKIEGDVARSVYAFFRDLAYARYNNYQPKRLIWEMAVQYYNDNKQQLKAELETYRVESSKRAKEEDDRIAKVLEAERARTAKQDAADAVPRPLPVLDPQPASASDRMPTTPEFREFMGRCTEIVRNAALKSGRSSGAISDSVLSYLKKIAGKSTTREMTYEQLSSTLAYLEILRAQELIHVVEG